MEKVSNSKKIIFERARVPQNNLCGGLTFFVGGGGGHVRARMGAGANRGVFARGPAPSDYLGRITRRAEVIMGSPSFPYLEVAAKIALALAVGLLVGLEREWAQKEVGVRTFSIIALLGTLVVLFDARLMPTVLLGAFLLVGLINLQSL